LTEPASQTEPPIVIVGSRLKMGIAVGVSVVFVLFGLVLMMIPEIEVRHGGFVAGFFGLCLVVFGWQVVRPTRLVLDPSGLALSIMWRRRHARWDQVGNFRVWTPQIFLNYVACDFTPDRPSGAKTSIMILPAGWKMRSSEVVALLEECKSRWA